MKRVQLFEQFHVYVPRVSIRFESCFYCEFMLQVANHAECSKIGGNSAPNGHIFLSVMAAALLNKAKIQNLDSSIF